MPDSPVTILRRKRARIHRQLDRYERMVTIYQAKLVTVEAGILALAPELDLPRRHRNPNPVFARGELIRLALTILREAGEPLPVRVIAVRALATKGITLPDKRAMKLTRLRLQQAFVKLGRRGVVRSVGDGRERMRELIA